MYEIFIYNIIKFDFTNTMCSLHKNDVTGCMLTATLCKMAFLSVRGYMLDGAAKKMRTLTSDSLHCKLIKCT